MCQADVLNRSCHKLIYCNFNISILLQSQLLGLDRWCLVSTGGCSSRQCWKIMLRGMVQNLWQVLAVELQPEFLTTGWWSCGSLRGSGLRASNKRHHVLLLLWRGFSRPVASWCISVYDFCFSMAGDTSRLEDVLYFTLLKQCKASTCWGIDCVNKYGRAVRSRRLLGCCMQWHSKSPYWSFDSNYAWRLESLTWGCSRFDCFQIISVRATVFSSAWEQGWQCCGQWLVGPSSPLVCQWEVSAWTGVRGQRPWAGHPLDRRGREGGSRAGPRRGGNPCAVLRDGVY